MIDCARFWWAVGQMLRAAEDAWIAAEIRRTARRAVWFGDEETTARTPFHGPSLVDFLTHARGAHSRRS